MTVDAVQSAFMLGLALGGSTIWVLSLFNR
jgi:hypothetical protein